MSFELQIAVRYLTQKKETGFITLITYISTIGLAIGVAALILTLGVLNGFERSIKEKVIEFQAHVRLETYHNRGFSEVDVIQDSVASYDQVAAVSAFIQKECMLRFRRQTEGVIVRGIEPDKIQEVINIESLLKFGSLDLSANEEGTYGIIIGIDLYEIFDMKIGDLVVLSSPPGTRPGLLGRPVIRQYELRGVFEIGMSEFDNVYTFIRLDEAQSYFNMENQLSGIDIRLHDIHQSKQFARVLTKDLGYPFFVRAWEEIHEMLFNWLHVQRLPILIAFGMIILVGSINLVSTHILVILEKKKDIGILKSMGASSKTIMNIFFLIGITVGIIATISGSLLALMLGWIQNNYQIITLSKDVYYIGDLYIDLDWKTFLQIGIIANVLCLFATVYPAWKVSQSLPAEAIREN